MTDVNFPQDFYLDDVGVWRLKKEKLAELEKPKPLTNEEWIKSASAEQLADVIADFYLLGYTHGHNKMDITSRTKWVEWLKQTHGGE